MQLPTDCRDAASPIRLFDVPSLQTPDHAFVILPQASTRGALFLPMLTVAGAVIRRPNFVPLLPERDGCTPSGFPGIGGMPSTGMIGSALSDMFRVVYAKEKIIKNVSCQQ